MWRSLTGDDLKLRCRSCIATVFSAGQWNRCSIENTLERWFQESLLLFMLFDPTPCNRKTDEYQNATEADCHTSRTVVCVLLCVLALRQGPSFCSRVIWEDLYSYQSIVVFCLWALGSSDNNMLFCGSFWAIRMKKHLEETSDSQCIFLKWKHYGILQWKYNILLQLMPQGKAQFLTWNLLVVGLSWKAWESSFTLKCNVRFAQNRIESRMWEVFSC